MSRRRRAIAFAAAALLAAAAAAAMADGYGASVARGYGELRPVVVAVAKLPAGRPIAPHQAVAELELRRIPARFVPPGALRSPAAAVGLSPTASVPAGSYLLASQLRLPRTAPPEGPRLGQGRRPVRIEVAGAGAPLEEGAPTPGSRVDVVVTSEPTGSGPGRTYVAAAAVPLLALAPGTPGAPSEEAAAATLGLTRVQALRLIAADSFARQVTLLPRG